MNDDPGDLFVVLGSLFLIWAVGYIVVQVVIHLWPWLLLGAGVIGIIWLLLALWNAWATDNQEWERLERDWYEHMESELEQIARRREALESEYWAATAPDLHAELLREPQHTTVPKVRLEDDRFKKLGLD